MHDVAGRLILRRAAENDFEVLRRIDLEADGIVGFRLAGRIPPPSLHRDLIWNDAVFDTHLAIASASRAPLGYLGLYDHSVRTSSAWLNVVGGAHSIGTGAMTLAVGAYLEVCFRLYPLRSIMAEIAEGSLPRLGTMLDAIDAERVGSIPASGGRSTAWVRIRREAFRASGGGTIAAHVRPFF